MVDTVDTKTFHKDGLTNTNSLLCHFAIQRMLSIEGDFLLHSHACQISIRNAPGLTLKSLNFKGRVS